MSENRNSEIEAGLNAVNEQIALLEAKFNGAAGQDIETEVNPDTSIRAIGVLIEMLPSDLKGFQDRLSKISERFDSMFNYTGNEAGKMIEVESIRVEIPPAITREKT